MIDRSKFLQIAREEMRKHTFNTFVENPPSVAQRGRGVSSQVVRAAGYGS